MSLGMYTQDEVRDFAEPPRNVTPVKVNPFIEEPVETMEIEAEIVQPVEVEVVPETKKQPVKTHVDKIAQAFEAMAKEVEP
jgi:hypothetical protein